MGVDNGALARRYMTEIWANGNVDAIDELCDDQISLQDPMTPEAVVGKQELRNRVEMMPSMFTDQSVTIKDVIVAGDRVVVCHTWRATHTGDFFAVKPTGKQLSCDAVEILRIKNGKVVENISMFDNYGMFQQMGALPPPDQLKPIENQPITQTPPSPEGQATAEGKLPSRSQAV